MRGFQDYTYGWFFENVDTAVDSDVSADVLVDVSVETAVDNDVSADVLVEVSVDTAVDKDVI